MDSKLILNVEDTGVTYPCIMQHKMHGTVAIWHTNTTATVLVASNQNHTDAYARSKRIGNKITNPHTYYDPTMHWSPLPKGSQIVITV